MRLPTYEDNTAPPDARRAPVNVAPSENVRAATVVVVVVEEAVESTEPPVGASAASAADASVVFVVVVVPLTATAASVPFAAAAPPSPATASSFSAIVSAPPPAAASVSSAPLAAAPSRSGHPSRPRAWLHVTNTSSPSSSSTRAATVCRAKHAFSFSSRETARISDSTHRGSALHSKDASNATDAAWHTLETSSLKPYDPTTSGANVAVAVAASSTNGVSPDSGALACTTTAPLFVTETPASTSSVDVVVALLSRNNRRYALEPSGALVIVQRYRKPSASFWPAVHLGAAFHQIQLENGDDRRGVAASHGSVAFETASGATFPAHISASSHSKCAR